MHFLIFCDFIKKLDLYFDFPNSWLNINNMILESKKIIVKALGLLSNYAKEYLGLASTKISKF